MEGADGGHCDIGTQGLYSSSSSNSRCGHDQEATKALHISMDGKEQKGEAVGLRGLELHKHSAPQQQQQQQPRGQ